MNRFIPIVLGAVGLSALAIGGIAVAGPHGGPGGHGVEGHFLRVMHQLDLTDAQKQSLKDIRETNREDREAMHAEREAEFALLKEQLLSDTPDVALLHQRIDERASLAQERAHARLDTLLDIRAILTPEQRAQVATELDSMRERRDEMRKRFEGGERPREGRRPRFGE